jgi:hypothetical protein
MGQLNCPSFPKSHNKRQTLRPALPKNAASAEYGAFAAPASFPDAPPRGKVGVSDVSGFVSSLPLQTSGPDAKNLLATRLLVSLPTCRVVSFFFTGVEAGRANAQVIAPALADMAGAEQGALR